MSYGSKGGHGYGNNSLRRARKVQARRSLHARQMDRSLKAPKAETVDQWLNAPNRYDLPTVDENSLMKTQFKQKLIESLKALPEWKTTSDKERNDILYAIEHKPAKMRQLYHDYRKSGKPFEEWFKHDPF